jgi:Carboxypeptidase regulatory-like domain
MRNRCARFHFVLALAIFLVCEQACAQERSETTASGNGAVAGHVFCADTQKPARFAMVRLTAVSANGFEGGSFFGMANTAADGSFLANNVRPGEYYVSAQMPGYIDPLRSFAPRGTPRSTNDLPDALKGMLTEVTVSANQTTTVQVTVFRGALLAGTVTYDDGTAAVGIPLTAQRIDNTTQNDGEAPAPVTLRDLAFTTSSDRGDFRLGGLPDGVYIVMARPRGSNGPGTLPVYFGNVLRKSDAMHLELKAGEERDGIDLQIPATGLRQVSGTVQAAKDGHGIGRAMVSLTLTGESGDSLNTVSAADGSFRFQSVPNGKFTVRVSGASDPLTVRGSSSDNADSPGTYGSAEVNIELNGGDVDNVVLSLPATGTHSSPANFVQ